jgi:WD40 repeat protein
MCSVLNRHSDDKQSSPLRSPASIRLGTISFDRSHRISHTGAVHSAAWSPDGKRLATGSHDNTAKVWDVDGGQEVLTLRGHRGSMNSVAWSPDSTRLVTGSNDETVKIWDAAGGQWVKL